VRQDILLVCDMLATVVAEPLGLGLLACKADRSGLDPKGTGGGSCVSTSGTAGCGGMSTSLFSPNDNADRLTLSSSAAEGRGGILRSFSCSIVVCWSIVGSSTICFRGGNRGGKDGLALRGRGAWSVRIAGVGTSVELEGALTIYFGLSDEYCDFAASVPLGGRGGSSASPQAGALTLLAESFDRVLAIVSWLVPLEYADPLEAPEELDSTESLLISCSEGRRAGREGGGRER